MWRNATSDSANGNSVQPSESSSSHAMSRLPGTASRSPANDGNSQGMTGASAVSASVPAPSSSAVTVSGSPCSTRRLLSVPKMPTSNAESAPTTMPMRMSAGTPPTTSATPGNTATPSARSRRLKRVPASQGSSSAVNTLASAMQVAATDAFASLIAP